MTMICKNCRQQRVLKMFVGKKNGVWVYLERCKICRTLAKPFRKFWRKYTPEIREKNRMARRARLAGAAVIIPFTKSEIINRDGLVCYLCNKTLTVKTATIDHVIPLSKRGFHCPSNVRIACQPCNNEKYNKIGE